MQTPTMKTPVSKCLDLAAYSVRMLDKFPNHAGLTGLAAKMNAVAGALDGAQGGYLNAVRAILPARVDVKYENFVSDRRVRKTQQMAEIADGKKNGAIAKHLFPEGSAMITRLVGQSQVDAMIALEGRLAALTATWPEAAAEEQAITEHRTSYGDAVDGRTKAGQGARAARATRDVAKQAFLATYAEIQSRVAAAFPLDSTMQELFFDEVRTRSLAEQADETDDVPTDEEKAPQPA